MIVYLIFLEAAFDHYILGLPDDGVECQGLLCEMISKENNGLRLLMRDGKEAAFQFRYLGEFLRLNIGWNLDDYDISGHKNVFLIFECDIFLKKVFAWLFLWTFVFAPFILTFKTLFKIKSAMDKL